MIEKRHRQLGYILLAIALAGVILAVVFAYVTDAWWGGTLCAVGGATFGTCLFGGIGELRFANEVKGWDRT